MKVKKLNQNAIIPTKGSEYAAGHDLYACIEEPITVPPHTTKKIGTGIAIAVPHGYFGAIYARSGLATKCGLRPANAVGVVDSDYRGEVIVAIHNDSEVKQTIKHGDRIAQLIISPYFVCDLTVSDDLGETERGAGGFGSTGISLEDANAYEQLSWIGD